MSILISGDFHLNAMNEFKYITRKKLKNKFGDRYSSIKYQIITGDSGFFWPGTLKHESEYYFGEYPWPVLFIPGNHENYTFLNNLNNLEEIDIGFKNPVYKICKNIYYMPRGKIYNINGKRILALGGALSIDKHLRQSGKSWWPEEYWSQEEKDNLFKLLKKDNKFDLVISHTGPERINKWMFKNVMSSYSNIEDEVGILNDKIDNMIITNDWYCGHLHIDSYYYCPIAKRLYRYIYIDPILVE